MQKETVVFVHGAWHGKWCWDIHFRTAFENAGYDVVTFDLPGHDQPGKIKGINKYSIKDYTNALIEVVSKLDRPPIIIGHSMGGIIVQKYLETHTCAKAILLAPAPSSGVLRTTLNFARKSYFYPSLLTLNLYGLVNTEKKSSESFFSKSLPKSELKAYTDQLCSESFLAFLNMLWPRVKINHHIKVPMLVLGAEHDAIFTGKENANTAKKYNADFIMIDDIAHDMMLDVGHERVSGAIIGWLGR